MSNKLQTLKGFRDFLPKKMALRNEVIARFVKIFQRYGFDELQTPSLEYKEVLSGKYGKEAEKLMYLFKDRGNRDVGLRYDLTVPLARVMATNQDLQLPLKRYQIQPVWRADKPQKGRYREIYMCDIDIVGSNSPLADAEIISITYECLTSLEFESFKIKVNSREVLFGSMKTSKIPKEKWLTLIQTLDKLDKYSESEVKKEMTSKGAANKQIKTIIKTLQNAKPDEYLAETIRIAKQFGVDKNIEFNPFMSRGLDYYTGPIFETVVDKPKIGSITGGGRYNRLLKTLGGPDLPATGTSIGLDRIVDVIEENKLLKDVAKTSTKVLVTMFSAEELEPSIKMASFLRKSGLNTEIYPDEKASLKKQLKYADKKGIPWAVIIGPKEVASGTVVLKNLKSQKQEKVFKESLLIKIR